MFLLKNTLKKGEAWRGCRPLQTTPSAHTIRSAGDRFSPALELLRFGGSNSVDLADSMVQIDGVKLLHQCVQRRARPLDDEIKGDDEELGHPRHSRGIE